MNLSTDDGGHGGDGGDGSPGSSRYGDDGGDGYGSRLLLPGLECCWQETQPVPAAGLRLGLPSHRVEDPEFVVLEPRAGS